MPVYTLMLEDTEQAGKVCVGSLTGYVTPIREALCKPWLLVKWNAPHESGNFN